MLVKCSCQACRGHLEFDAVDAGSSVACPHCGAETVLSLQKSVSKPTVTSVAEQSANKPMIVIALNRIQFAAVCVVLVVLLCFASLGIINLLSASHNKSELPNSKSESPSMSGNVQKPEPPAYIHRVVGSMAGMDGVKLYVILHDSKDKETAANGKITIELYDNYTDSNYNDKLNHFKTKIFEIKINDFKDADYGLWSAYMWVSPRIKFNGYVPKSKYGEADVTFICQDGTKLSGVYSALQLTP
jgi:hypothetical protein